MPEQELDAGVDGRAVPAPRPPVPDLGFFAGAPSPPGAMATPFDGAAGPAFGAPPSPFGQPGPAPVAAAAPPATSGFSTRWKVGAAAAAALLLVGLVLGGRFGWQQFLADPVAPATLAGMPRVSNGEVDAMAGQLDGQLGKDLTAGSKTAVALYSDGLGTGYLLVAIRGGSRPGSGSEKNAFDGWSEFTQAGATCRTPPTAAPTGMMMTVCVHGFWRRAVMVAGFSTRTSDPATVARATKEAWDAQ